MNSRCERGLLHGFDGRVQFNGFKKVAGLVLVAMGMIRDTWEIMVVWSAVLQ